MFVTHHSGKVLLRTLTPKGKARTPEVLTRQDALQLAIALLMAVRDAERDAAMRHRGRAMADFRDVLYCPDCGGVESCDDDCKRALDANTEGGDHD